MYKKLKILVIDDDKDMCDFLTGFLTEEGYIVKTLNKGSKVISELKKENYQIVLLDLKMPDVKGEEVLKQIRKTDTDLCVIIITAYPSIDSAIETMKNEAYDYIKKPFKIAELREVIQSAVKRKGLVANPEEILNIEIGNKVRGLRKQQKLTLKQLAGRTGLSVSLISQIELAKTSASVSTLHKLARALNVDLVYFFEHTRTAPVLTP
jgi:DNA-binding NtrC family response regulator